LGKHCPLFLVELIDVKPKLKYMLNERVQKKINDQINAELWSAYLYLSMSAYFEDEGLNGFANWMRIQYQEEVTHAMKFFDYVNNRGGRVWLKPIDGVPAEWESTLAIFEETLEHEKKVTAMINDIMKVAREENDYATESMLQWFIDEQVEEEDAASEILDHLKFIDGKGQGILMLDRELGNRQFVDETQEE